MLKVHALTLGAYQVNCYIIHDEKSPFCCVIDPGYEADTILDKLSELGLTLEAILLTHGHFDHIGGVRELAREGAEILIHREDAPMLTSPELNASWLVGDAVTAPQATRTVREGERITYAGVTFTVLHTPGHTPGGVCYQTGQWLFTGDTLFHGGYGRTDLPGGSMQQLADSLRRLYPMARQFEIFPGH